MNSFLSSAARGLRSMATRLMTSTLAMVVALSISAAGVIALSVPTPGYAALSFSTTVRTARAQAVITAAGASAKLKVYNGTRPAGVGAVTGGNTLCAQGTFGSTIGTASAGALDFDEAGFTQNSATFTSCTPTFVDITTSGDVVVARIDIGAGAGNWQFTGTVATGQNLTLTTLVFAEGNAS
jgi:hypothetical protein